MKDYIKNNFFISFVLIVMWIFFLCLSIAEKGLFTKHIMEVVGTTISFIGMGAVIKTNKDKIKKIKENRKEINKEETEKIEESGENNIKTVNPNKGKIILKIYIGVLLGIATIITIGLFLIYKVEFSFYLFLLTIMCCCIGEIAIAGVIGITVSVGSDYVKDCKKDGFLKATIGLILLLIFVAFVVYNKDAKLFQK